MKIRILIAFLTLLFLPGITVLAGGNPKIKSLEEIQKEALSNSPAVSIDQYELDVKNEKTVTIDIRSEEEFIAGYIPDSIWIPRGKLEYAIGAIVSDPNTKIVVYCFSGARSAFAAKTLKSLGYQNASFLEGGIKEWVNQSKPLFNDLYGEIKVLSLSYPRYANTCFNSIGFKRKK